MDAGAFAELGAGVRRGVDIGKRQLAILDAPIVRHMQREDDFFRQHRRQPERLARRQLLDLPSRRALPSRARLQARARRIVEGNIEDAVVVVFGIDAALGREPLDNRIERSLARERKFEERSRLMRLRLRSDQPRRGPRGFLPEPPALKHRDLDALRREPPRDRTTYNAAADYQSFHSNPDYPTRHVTRKHVAQGSEIVASMQRRVGSTKNPKSSLASRFTWLFSGNESGIVSAAHRRRRRQIRGG